MSADEKSGAQAAVEAPPAEEYFEAVLRGSVEELLDAGAHTEIDAMRHSAAHVMAEAVVEIFPDAKLGIGPSIDEGFYYDFLLPRPLTPDDLAAIEAGMRASIGADHPFVRKEFPFEDGRAYFEARNQPFKVEILDDLATRAAESDTPLPLTSTFEHGQFVDLCKGPHVASTGAIGPFKLMSVAGAYWRGSEKRPMLQRIYGTVWSTQEELDSYLMRRE
jgi:threonyl-tRNA synthetase